MEKPWAVVVFECSVYSMMQLCLHGMLFITGFVYSDARHTCWHGSIEWVFNAAAVLLAASQIHNLTLHKKLHERENMSKEVRTTRGAPTH